MGFGLRVMSLFGCFVLPSADHLAASAITALAALTEQINKLCVCELC